MKVVPVAQKEREAYRVDFRDAEGLCELFKAIVGSGLDAEILAPVPGRGTVVLLINDGSDDWGTQANFGQYVVFPGEEGAPCGVYSREEFMRDFRVVGAGAEGSAA